MRLNFLKCLYKIRFLGIYHDLFHTIGILHEHRKVWNVVSHNRLIHKQQICLNDSSNWSYYCDLVKLFNSYHNLNLKIFCGVYYVKIYPNDFVVFQELNLTVEVMIYTQAPSLYRKVHHLPVTTGPNPHISRLKDALLLFSQDKVMKNKAC